MAARPAAPSANLKSVSAGEEPCVIVEDGGFVLVDEADLRIAPIDVPGMGDLFPAIRPSRTFLVARDPIREEPGKIGNLKVLRDIIRIHYGSGALCLRRFQAPW